MDGDQIGSEQAIATGQLMRQLLEQVATLQRENSRLELELEIERQANGLLRQRTTANT